MLSTPSPPGGTDDKRRSRAPSLEFKPAVKPWPTPSLGLEGICRIPFGVRLDEECVDTLRLRAHLAPLPLREEHDAVTRDMQTTIRYEHSPDSAMRPVQPDGTSMTDSRHPSGVTPHLERYTSRRPRTSAHTAECSLKTLDEPAIVATRLARPSNSTRLKSYPIKTSACSSRLATNEIFDVSPD